MCKIFGKGLVWIVLTSALAGCASQEKPVGVGRGTDEYRPSPCACLQIPLKGPDAEFLRRMQPIGNPGAVT